MLPYFLLLAFFAIGALASGPRVNQTIQGRQVDNNAIPVSPIFLIGIIGMILMIGFRYRVGGDWNNYEYILDQFRGRSFGSSLGVLEPGYGALNWLAQQLGFEVWFVNLSCAGIFGWGLYRFCRSEPAPWLCVALAIPYMVIVLAMGYTRQAAALGFLMAGLARQTRGAPAINFAVYAAAAAMFHKSAIVVFPLIAASGKGNKFVNILIVASLSIGLYSFFLSDSVDDYVSAYITTAYSSQGALVRVAMNALAAAMFWVYGKRLAYSDEAWKIWRNFSLASIASSIALALSPSSTAVDRVSLYLLPLQLTVIARAGVISKNQGVGTAMVVGYAALVEFVWLNFAQFASFWVPYQLYPFS